MGVVKALWNEQLLPRVISGASAGSLMAAMIGTVIPSIHPINPPNNTPDNTPSNITMNTPFLACTLLYPGTRNDEELRTILCTNTPYHTTHPVNTLLTYLINTHL